MSAIPHGAASMSNRISLIEIEAARGHIADRIEQTALKRSEALTARCHASVFMKLENRQKTGSFKLRGATNAIATLSSRGQDSWPRCRLNWKSRPGGRRRNRG
jgi:threonine dehydratase